MVACEPGHSLPDSWDGKFEILKWLQRDHGCIFGNASISYFEIREVVWAAGECSDFPSSALLFSHHRHHLSFAVNHNDLECLKWVRAQGVTWGEIVYGPNENGTFDG